MNPGVRAFIICPHCEAENQPGAARCRICRDSLVFELGPNEAAPAVSPAGERTFNLRSLMLLIALLAVCLGVARAELGLGIVMMIVTTPSLLRTFIAVKRRKDKGEPMTTREKLGSFAGSVGVVMVVGISALIAFIATFCFPVSLASVFAGLCGVPGSGGEVGFYLGAAMGVLAAGFTAYHHWNALSRRSA